MPRHPPNSRRSRTTNATFLNQNRPIPILRDLRRPPPLPLKIPLPPTSRRRNRTPLTPRPTPAHPLTSLPTKKLISARSRTQTSPTARMQQSTLLAMSSMRFPRARAAQTPTRASASTPAPALALASSAAATYFSLQPFLAAVEACDFFVAQAAVADVFRCDQTQWWAGVFAFSDLWRPRRGGALVSVLISYVFSFGVYKSQLIRAS